MEFLQDISRVALVFAKVTLFSLIMFVLSLNVLRLMLNKATNDGIFSYHPRCSDSQISHLRFVDDLLIFLDGSETSLAGVFLGALSV